MQCPTLVMLPLGEGGSGRRTTTGACMAELSPLWWTSWVSPLSPLSKTTLGCRPSHRLPRPSPSFTPSSPPLPLLHPIFPALPPPLHHIPCPPICCQVRACPCKELIVKQVPGLHFHLCSLPLLEDLSHNREWLHKGSVTFLPVAAVLL